MKHVIHKATVNRHRQKGAITMFSAVLILILLTEMVLYAVQVGVFEQRKSANEVMQKLSFHAADAGIQQGKQFIARNAGLVVDEWVTEGRWQLCENMTASSSPHPCYGEPVQALRDGTYFYSFAAGSYPAGITCSPGADNELPLCWDELGADTGEAVTVHVLLCMLNIHPDPNASPRVITPNGCIPFGHDNFDSRYFMLTLLARGESDCDGAGNCGAETLIAEKLASFALGSDEGGPAAPLTARTNVPLSGTVEIVPNPNGGGIGVPISSWINTNPNCDDTPSEPITPISGSYATCEKHEWYGQDIMPDDAKCPTQNCSCDLTRDKMITYASGNDREMGIDIVPDIYFPCDNLVEAMLGINPEKLKGLLASQGRVLSDCDSLDATSEGPYWISGSTCRLKDQIGSKDNTVLLISAASNTSVSAGAEVFGTLVVTDLEDESADFTGNGHATIYGAAIMDAEMEHFNGTFQIVYVEEIIDDSFDFPLTGAIAGGWTDFHEAWR